MHIYKWWYDPTHVSLLFIYTTTDECKGEVVQQEFRMGVLCDVVKDRRGVSLCSD
jgi:hypothetical protein